MEFGVWFIRGGLNWVIAGSIKEELMLGGASRGIREQLIPLATFRVILQQRIGRAFEDIKFHVDRSIGILGSRP